MTQWELGARVVAGGAPDKPGTVVGLPIPVDLFAVTPVMWDADRHFVAMIPTSVLIAYRTEDQKLEDLAVSLGFRPAPTPGSDTYLADARKWREDFRAFKQNVRQLATKKETAE